MIAELKPETDVEMDSCCGSATSARDPSIIFVEEDEQLFACPSFSVWNRFWLKTSPRSWTSTRDSFHFRFRETSKKELLLEWSGLRFVEKFGRHKLIGVKRHCVTWERSHHVGKYGYETFAQLGLSTTHGRSLIADLNDGNFSRNCCPRTYTLLEYTYDYGGNIAFPPFECCLPKCGHICAKLANRRRRIARSREERANMLDSAIHLNAHA